MKSTAAPGTSGLGPPPALGVGVPPRARARGRRRAARPWIAIALVAALMWPTAYPLVLGTVQLPPYRVLLLLGLLVIAARMAQGAFKLRPADWVIALVSLSWAGSLIAHHGLFEVFVPDSSRGEIPSLGYEAVVAAILETSGAYFLARATITGPDRFESFMRALGWGVLLMCIPTMLEAYNGVNIFGVYAGAGIGEVRYGLHRAAGPFPHSILWGLFAAMPFAYFAAQVIWRRRIKAAPFAIASLVGVVTSVSSTAVLAVLVQMFALGWSRVIRFKRRWTILAFTGVVFFLFIEVAAERPAVNVLVSHLTLNPSTGFYRIVQWEYGWQEVVRNPIWGIGMNVWERPEWLSASVDSFWLSLMMRTGLLTTGLLILAVVMLLVQAARAAARRDVSRRLRLLIRIWAITICSLLVAGLAVHFWAQSLVVFFFLLGCLGGLSRPDVRAAAPRAAPSRALHPGARA